MDGYRLGSLADLEIGLVPRFDAVLSGDLEHITAYEADDLTGYPVAVASCPRCAQPLPCPCGYDGGPLMPSHWKDKGAAGEISFLLWPVARKDAEYSLWLLEDAVHGAAMIKQGDHMFLLVEVATADVPSLSWLAGVDVRRGAIESHAYCGRVHSIRPLARV